MVRHIVAWNHQDQFTPEERAEHAANIKRELESLKDLVPDLLEIKVITPEPTSNRDLMLTSLFPSAEALAAYQIHPEHKRVSGYVGSVMHERACLDFVED